MKALVAKYGWKTVSGCLVMAAGQLMQTIPATAPYAPVATALGIALGGVGVRAAIAKIAADAINPKEQTHV